VLVSDVVMPGMDGVTLCREARKIAPHVNIILASGFPTASLKENHAYLDEFRILSKPFRMADVAKLLRQVS
jgi:YesN/AraC family two-component response regulator